MSSSGDLVSPTLLTPGKWSIGDLSPVLAPTEGSLQGMLLLRDDSRATMVP